MHMSAHALVENTLSEVIPTCQNTIAWWKILLAQILLINNILFA